MSERLLFVHVDLQGTTHYVGRLWTRHSRGRESASFEYDTAWLENPNAFALEPALALGRGTQHTQQGRALFGAIGDSSPDRWGRRLIQREERRIARVEARQPHTLGEGDYLAAVSDITRQGALRFTETQDGPFIAPSDAASVPPLVRLGDLLHAADHVEADDETDADLRLLLAPGSSLGGARAKASVIDQDGALSIAKFPQVDDAYAIIPWEAVSLSLASDAGIEVPSWRLEQVAGRSVLLLRRFDRDGALRIPFLSAMSMIGAADNEEHSYLELVDALRVHGAQPEKDCAQLWRRIVFTILISNTDDHLRNHGFLSGSRSGWRLSPVYDINPTPTDLRPRVLSLAIDETETTASLALAFDVASEFGLKPNEAKQIAREVGAAVRNWRARAAEFGLSAREQQRMESAFEHEDLRLANT